MQANVMGQLKSGQENLIIQTLVKLTQGNDQIQMFSPWLFTHLPRGANRRVSH